MSITNANLLSLIICLFLVTFFSLLCPTILMLKLSFCGICIYIKWFQSFWQLTWGDSFGNCGIWKLQYLVSLELKSRIWLLGWLSVEFVQNKRFTIGAGNISLKSILGLKDFERTVQVNWRFQRSRKSRFFTTFK